MSASERLREISYLAPATHWKSRDVLFSALPELIEVVEAAENAEDHMVAVRKIELETFLQVPLSQWLPVVTAVAALDEALSTKGER